MPDRDTFCSFSTQGPLGIDCGPAKAMGERIKKKTNANPKGAKNLLVIFNLLSTVDFIPEKAAARLEGRTVPSLILIKSQGLAGRLASG